MPDQELPPLPILDVETAFPVVGYQSIHEAFAAAKISNQNSRAPQFSTVLSNSHFVDAQWNLQSWLLEFTDSRWLLIALNNSGLQWNVVREKPNWPSGRVKLPPLRWKNGVISHTDAADFVHRRRGCEFKRLWANCGHYSVYLKEQLILSFVPIRDINSGQLLLHVYEDD